MNTKEGVTIPMGDAMTDKGDRNPALIPGADLTKASSASMQDSTLTDQPTSASSGALIVGVSVAGGVHSELCQTIT